MFIFKLVVALSLVSSVFPAKTEALSLAQFQPEFSTILQAREKVSQLLSIPTTEILHSPTERLESYPTESFRRASGRAGKKALVLPSSQIAAVSLPDSVNEFFGNVVGGFNFLKEIVLDTLSFSYVPPRLTPVTPPSYPVRNERDDQVPLTTYTPSISLESLKSELKIELANYVDSRIKSLIPPPAHLEFQSFASDRVTQSVSQMITRQSDSDADRRSVIITGLTDGGTFTNTTITNSTITGTMTGTINPSFTSGSIPFQGASGLAEDNANLFWDNVNNRLGIGTTSPSDTFSLNGAAYLAQITAPSVTTDRLYNTGGDLYWAGSIIGGVTTGQWSTDGTHVWRASGNVGIGTTSPTSLLSVHGNGYFSGTGFFGGAITGTSTLAIQSTTATSTFSTGGLTVGTSQFVVQQTSGNVGIGTIAPLSKLDISGGVAVGSYAGVSAAPSNGMIISGPVAVGIVTPDVNTAFHVHGSAHFTSYDISGISGSAGFEEVGGRPGPASPLSGDLVVANGYSPFKTGGPYSASVAWHYYADENISPTTSGMSARMLLTPLGQPSSSRVTRFQLNADGTGWFSNGTFFGIGTTNPVQKLDVAGNVNVSTGSCFMVNGVCIGGGSGGDQWTTSGTNIYNSNTGNVGIGTTSPAVTLDVFGPVGTNLNAQNIRSFDTTSATTNTGGGISLSGYANGTSDRVNFVMLRGGKENSTAGSPAGFFAVLTRGDDVNPPPERMRITSTGNVGIGTTSPGAKLHLLSATDIEQYLDRGALTNYATLVFRTTSDNTHWAVGSRTTAAVGTANTFSIYSSTLGGNAVTILPTGNVGIGTAAPGYKLDINTTGTEDAQVAIRNTSTGNARVYFDAANGDLVGADYAWLGQDNDLKFGITTNSSAGDIYLMPKQGAGNVGIGTTSPWRTLSVTGTVGFDGLTGSTGAGSICLDANKQIVYNSASDACLSSTRATKKDIEELTVNALDIINQLESVSFIYKEGDGRTRFGFIAEDTADIAASLATYNEEGTVSGIDDRAILSVVVKAIKELYSEFMVLKQQVSAFAERIVSNEIQVTNQICIGNTCINETQLKALLAQTGTVTVTEVMPTKPTTDDQQPTTDTATTTAETTISEEPITEENATSTEPVIEEPSQESKPLAEEETVVEETVISTPAE